MSNEPKIPALLQRWSKVQPEACRRVERMGHPDYYIIGNYRFWHSPIYFVAQYGDSPELQVNGQPALDWLAGAIERAIEAAGDGMSLETKTYKGQSYVRLYNHKGQEALSGFHGSLTEAMLAAFVAYAEAVRE